jgi:hypothetical protein
MIRERRTESQVFILWPGSGLTDPGDCNFHIPPSDTPKHGCKQLKNKYFGIRPFHNCFVKHIFVIIPGETIRQTRESDRLKKGRP